MQDLGYPWIVGRTYKFEHAQGFWAGEVKILGYSQELWGPEDVFIDEDEEGWDAVEIEVLRVEPVGALRGDKVVKLSAQHPWRWEEINPCLENK